MGHNEEASDMIRLMSTTSEDPLLGEEHVARPRKRRLPVLRDILVSLACVIVIAIELSRILISSTKTITKTSEHAAELLNAPVSPARVAFEPSADLLPPPLSTLPDKYKRVTFVCVWESHNRPTYFNNFFGSAALNADVADFVVIDINNDEDSKCMTYDSSDGGTLERTKAWDWEHGGNIRVLCMNHERFLREQADWLCSKSGWDCSPEEDALVMEEMRARPDGIHSDWKAMRGGMFRKYFLHPENPLWGWLDMDTHLGRLAHLPLPIISTLSFMTFTTYAPSLLFLAGQMVIWNQEAPNYEFAWKRYEPLSSVEKFLEGEYMSGGVDELIMSTMYMQDQYGAGHGLDWGVIGDVHGQDYFVPGKKWVISGRDVLEADDALTRLEIETILQDAAAQPVAEYGGWSSSGTTYTTPMLYGKICKAFHDIPEWAQCYQPHNLTAGDQFTRIDSVRRASVVRLGNDPQGQLHVRLEPDRRPRRWQRKLFLHYQEIKRQKNWFELPPHMLDEDTVMELHYNKMQVWKKGQDRDKDIWYRFDDLHPGVRRL